MLCNFLFGVVLYILLIGILHRDFNLFWGELATLLATFFSVYLGRRYLDRRSFASLGWKVDGRAYLDLMAGFLISGSMMGMIYFIEKGVGWLTFQGFIWESVDIKSVIVNTAIMFLLFIFAAIQEELLFRGYILQNISEGLNILWGVFISSGIFAIMHLSNPGFSLMALVGIFLSGLFIAFGYIRTHRLWLPIGIHLGWNFFEGTVFGFQVSGLEEIFHLIRQSVYGPGSFTGESFGPEAGLVLLPALAVGFLLVWIYTSSKLQK